MNITEDLTGYNLLFEVEDVGTAYNPTGLSVSLWNAYEGDGQYEAPIPMDRHAEHKTTRATGKIWAVGMNNNCFSLGEARLAIQCGPTPMNYVVHVIPVSAELFLGTTLHGEVCPGEWVYHFIDPGLIGAGHYGSGHHLHFNIHKPPVCVAPLAVPLSLSPLLALSLTHRTLPIPPHPSQPSCREMRSRRPSRATLPLRSR